MTEIEELQRKLASAEAGRTALLIAGEQQQAEIQQLRAQLPTCNGICMTGHDIGVPEAGRAIAYPHPDCELHGDPIGEAMRRADQAEAVLAKVRELALTGGQDAASIRRQIIALVYRPEVGLVETAPPTHTPREENS